MPKKFQGGNSRAIAANEKKAAAKAEKDAKIRAEKEAEETAKWGIGSKKGGKAEEKKAKRQEQLELKREKEKQLELENKEIAKSKPARGPAPKTSARGAKKAEEKELQIAAAEDSNKKIESFAASNIDDALNLMDSIDDPSSSQGSVSKDGVDALVDRHPERRAKAAYNLFLERETPRMREENPTLRLSKIRDILWKEWKKSPENPMNISRVSHNTTQASIDAIIEEERKNIKDKLRID
ncbi:hypothetical protein IW140_005383 [Coemansia sp. RSA 1813]|nr:hypothetical protein EV178_005498 [Coemansia sp. RSA 1646]KAJ1769035.1 hypothetical protein LPJ74_004399 [Coemansia sp. RSA 1843]KAJ2086663.1 hypothetical protein IW138_005534 [Coemansia sp. RSA 986]KAJ2211452.1 hypothetical protein EV179_005494 [Coemansia sp. RSA 487]KAJ2565270.1 hypothetical protein IW140_005383 [Coemansia sp. RSA 1813]